VKWYPENLRVGPEGTTSTIEFITQAYERNSTFHYAEFGIYQGSTAHAIASYFPNATLHLFDFDSTLEKFSNKFLEFGNRIILYGNSQKYNDSYNWNLSKILELGNLRFDYCFLDGAHTFAVDALTFFLTDRLLNESGFIDFDDYHWRIRGSSLDPKFVPEILDQYTDEQIDDYQVRRLVESLVKTDPTYDEIIKNKIYQKNSANRFKMK